MKNMKLYEKNGIRRHFNTYQADAFKQHGWKEAEEAPAESTATTYAEEVPEKPATADVISDSELNEMTKEQLLEYARKIGVNASDRANKASLINAIREKRK